MIRLALVSALFITAPAAHAVCTNIPGTPVSVGWYYPLSDVSVGLSQCIRAGNGNQLQCGTDQTMRFVTHDAARDLSLICDDPVATSGCLRCRGASIPLAVPDAGHTFWCRVRGYGEETSSWSAPWCWVNGPSAPPASAGFDQPAPDAPGQVVTFRVGETARALEYWLEIEVLGGSRVYGQWLGLSDASGPNGPGRTLVGSRIGGFADSGHDYRYRWQARNPLGTSALTAWRTVRNGPSAAPEAPYGLDVGPVGSDGCLSLDFVQGVGSHDFTAEFAYDTAFEQSADFPDAVMASLILDRSIPNASQRTTLCLDSDLGRRMWLRLVGQNSLGTAVGQDAVQVDNPEGERCSHPQLATATDLDGAPLPMSVCWDEERRQYLLIDKARRENWDVFGFDGAMARTEATRDRSGISTRRYTTDENAQPYDLVFASNERDRWPLNTEARDAVVAHANTALVYDYLWHQQQFNSIDNAGRAMELIIGVTEEFSGVDSDGNPFYCPARDNAAWGFSSSVGINPAGPLGWRTADSLDVIAHEWGHAILDLTAHVQGTGETGSLAEAFGDWTAAAVTSHYQHGDPWVIGDDLGSGVVMRSMRDPSIPGSLNRAGPSTYLVDPLWRPMFGQPQSACMAYQSLDCEGTLDLDHNDGCYVHINAGVPNRAFYLLSQGGVQNSVTVSALGVASAYRIALHAVRTFWRRDMPHTLSFASAAAGMIGAAKALFGAASAQAFATERAWQAVGVVPGAGATPVPTPRSSAGDCNGNGTVAINELLTGVNIATGATPFGACAAMDSDGDQTVTISDLVRAVKAALA